MATGTGSGQAGLMIRFAVAPENGDQSRFFISLNVMPVEKVSGDIGQVRHLFNKDSGHCALPFRVIGNGSWVNGDAEMPDLERTRDNAGIAVHVGFFRFFKDGLKTGLADALRRVGESLGNANGQAVAGVAGMFLYEAGNLVQAGASKFNGVLPGELRLVLVVFGQLMVKEMDVVHVAVHSWH